MDGFLEEFPGFRRLSVSLVVEVITTEYTE
jgi:hypothetical protein